MILKKTNHGQTLLEVVMVLAIGTIMLVSIISLGTVSVKNTSLSRNKTQATKFSQEAIEWMRSERDSDWNTFVSKAAIPVWCLPDLSWSMNGSCSANDVISGTVFRREARFTQIDANTIEAISVVSWDDSAGLKEVKSSTYFTNWKASALSNIPSPGPTPTSGPTPVPTPTPPTGGPVTLFTTSFGTVENGTLGDGWQESNPAEIKDGDGETSGRPGGPTHPFARIGDGGWIRRQINATGVSSLQLKYYWRGDNDAESSDVANVAYCIGSNCTSFSNVATHSLGNNNWSSQVTINLPPSVNNTTFRIRFRVTASSSNEDFRLDDLTITGTTIP